MALSYEQFRAQYYQRAIGLAGDCGSSLAEKLCRLGYEWLRSKPGQRAEPRYVCAHLAMLHYDKFARLYDVQALAEVIYPNIELPASAEWIALDEFAERLSSIVRELPYHEQIMTCVKFMGWHYSCIANLMDELAIQLSGDIQTASSLHDVDGVVRQFVQVVEDKMLVHLEDNDWFHMLFEYRCNIENDFRIWQYLRKYCARSDRQRFARIGLSFKDRNARLRDIWRSIQDRIQKSIKQETFFRYE